MKFYTRYAPPKIDGFSQQGEISKTVQSEKDSCDVNLIMKRFERTGQISHVVTVPPQFIDTTQRMSYEDALMHMEDAKADFMALPSEVRTYFGHDPKTFIKVISDPSELDLQNFKKMNLIVEREISEKELLARVVENTKKEEPAKA